MAITNHERVGESLELLKAGLGPFVEREIKSAVAANSFSMSKVKSFVDDPNLANKGIGVVCHGNRASRLTLNGTRFLLIALPE